jgi:hypothetical protein
MKVFVNNIEITVFTGATAKDAIQSYFRSIQTSFPNPMPVIFDQYGNIIEPEGELSSDNQIFILETDNLSNHE